MLEITRKTLTFEPEEVMELERIITDEDAEGAYAFLKKSVYRKFRTSQENRLKSHLDGCIEPAGTFASKKK
jgi:hypothetical protein